MEDHTPEVDTRSLAHKTLDAYFAPKSFEKSGRLYECLGIRSFKRYMPTGEPAIKYLGKKDLIGQSTRTLMQFEKYSRGYEAVHTIAFGVITYMMLPDIVEGRWKSAGVKTALNILLNAYPVMIQRYNRARVERVLDHRKKDKKRAENIQMPRIRSIKS